MTSMVGLDHQTIADVTQRLVTAFDPEQIILFGSHAWGFPDVESDVDLMVIVSHSDVPLHQRMVQAQHALGHLMIAADIIVKTRLEFESLQVVRGSLEYRIAHDGKLLYERDEEQARAELVPQS